MTRQKRTFFRILRHAKNNHYSPVWYEILSFCAVVVFISRLGYAYLKRHQTQNNAMLASTEYSMQYLWDQNGHKVSNLIEKASMQQSFQMDLLIQKDNQEYHLESVQAEDDGLIDIFTHKNLLKLIVKSQNNIHSLDQKRQYSSSAKTPIKPAIKRSAQQPLSANEQVDKTLLASMQIARAKTHVIPKEITLPS